MLGKNNAEFAVFVFTISIFTVNDKMQLSLFAFSVF